MLNQTDIEMELRIEERRRALRLEKALSGHHKALAGILADLERNPCYEADAALQAALWALGVAIIQVGRTYGSR